ncbi:MAG: DUF2752 domain-containing protein [Armatimonadota bacterium]|nr:DUF2752 domain-containing protein [Armatimonadota bacterium]MCX7777301.1 DUF2752 domain-containing protein [Armatimonadota bacterium]MDW8024382.1 DUF2752 domain-containing protein [Armatimonadota bacterium]
MLKCFFSFRAQRLIAASVLFLATAYMAVLEQPPNLWPCMFYQLTGLPCSSCGMTRALFAAANGRFKEAFAWHPFGLILFAAAFGAAVLFALEAAIGRRLLKLSRRAMRAILITLILCFLLCWIIRLCIILGLKIPLPIYGLV